MGDTRHVARDFIQCARILDDLDRSDSVDAKILLKPSSMHLYAPARRGGRWI